MANKYLDSNGLLYLWQKIVNKFVAKETGKGLSTNDFTTDEKTKLAGLENYTLPTASDTVRGGIKIGAGLTMNGEVLSATGGGTADAVDWSNITNKPETFAPSNHSGSCKRSRNFEFCRGCGNNCGHGSLCDI